jgi:hypothetical protein
VQFHTTLDKNNENCWEKLKELTAALDSRLENTAEQKADDNGPIGPQA